MRMLYQDKDVMMVALQQRSEPTPSISDLPAPSHEAVGLVSRYCALAHGGKL